MQQVGDLYSGCRSELESNTRCCMDEVDGGSELSLEKKTVGLKVQFFFWCMYEHVQLSIRNRSFTISFKING